MLFVVEDCAKENPQTVKPAGTFIEIVDGGISKFIVSLS
jgi:hypothetical protein